MTHLPAGPPLESRNIFSQIPCEHFFETAIRTIRRAISRRARILGAALALFLSCGFCGSAMAQTLVPGWNQLLPVSSPPARYLHGMTYDAGRGQVVLFGGSSQGNWLNDTWLWNGTNWTAASPTVSPTPRSAFGMTYDATQGQVVLFGGRLSASTWSSDTWIWNGTTWNQASPSASPTERSNMTMVFDAAHGNDVLFGGLVDGTASNDTWIWNGTNWAQASPSAEPSARYSYSMVYDAAHGQVVLFGGVDLFGSYLNDTWVWNGTTWTQLSPGPGPTARYGGGMVYDPALGEVIMFGGISAGGDLNDTWTWNGSTWTQVSSSANPSLREDPNGVAYDSAQDQVLLFGGFDSSNTSLADTWEYGPAQNFGSINVCSGSTPAPCSNTLALTFNFPASTAIGSIKVVTQGTQNLDFTQANGGNCSGAISAGGSCTINIAFSPTAPGLRMGAVQFFGDTSNLIVSTPIYGIGQAPFATFSPLTTFVQDTGGGFPVLSPEGVAVDAAGDLFIADSGNNRVLEVKALSAGTQAIGTNFVSPRGLAVDGAGNVYVADPGMNSPTGEVIEIPVGCTSAPCQIVVYNPAPHPVPLGVAVDGLGNLYVADNPLGIVKIPPGCLVTSTSSCQTTVGSGLSQPTGVAVDASGNVFVADSGLHQIVKIPSSCTSGSCQTTVGFGWAAPQSVKLDAAGDVIVADSGLDEVLEVPVGCNIQACEIILAFPAFDSLAGNFQGVDAAPDGKGTIYIADVANNRIDAIIPGIEAFNFAESSVDNISGDSPRSVLFQNIGNQSLNAVSPGLQFDDPDFTQVPGPGSPGTPADCNSTFSLAPGAACNLSVQFDPLSAGSLNGDALFYDNSMNAPSTIQSFPFGGAGVSSGPSNTLQVAETGSGSGSVTSGDGAINCSEAGGNLSGTCAATYASGMVMLTETPGAGSIFLGWSGGGCTGTAPTCTVNVSAPVNVTASFGQQSAGNINLCSSGSPSPCSGAIAVTFDFLADTTISSIKVVTKGATGLDFQLGGGSTCAGTITAGSSCIANVNFVPLAPGLRMGAVELLDGAGNIIATQYVSGIGQAPQIVYGPAFSGSTILGGPSLENALATPGFTPNPRGMTTDASGNLYIADPTNGQLLKRAPNGTTTTVGTLGFPQGVAIDGAGNLFVADTGLREVVEIPAGCIAVGCQVPVYAPPSANPVAVVVDGLGDLFIAAPSAGGVVEVPAGCASSSCWVPIGSGWHSVNTLALDAAGDLFVADSSAGSVSKMPAGCTTNSWRVAVGPGWIVPQGIAVDAAGDVFVSDTAAAGGLGQVTEVPAGCSASPCEIALITGTPTTSAFVYDLAVDQLGQVYAADGGNHQILQINQSQPPTETFATTNVGSTSADSPQSFTLFNSGNQTLSAVLPGFAATGPNFYQVSGTGSPADCSANFSLAPGAGCNVSLSFMPQVPGSLSGTATATDNNLNAASATQTFQLSALSLGPPVGVGVTVGGAGTGFVESNPTGINCGTGGSPAACLANFSSGLTISLEEVPTGGSTFAGWGGACSSAGSNQFCNVTLTSTTSITANFAPAVIPTDNVAVTLLGSGVGTVTDSSTSINCTLTNGTLTGSCNFDYPVNSQVTLTAAPAVGTAFAGWGAPCSGTSPTCTFTVVSPLNINATFAQQSFGNVNVCPAGQKTPAPCSSSLAVNFSFVETTNLGAIQVVTQGATGLDFALGSGSTCTGTITAGNSCTANVTFTPLAPGLRTGAVSLYDNGGNLVATSPIYGIGHAPLAAFDPGRQSTLPVSGLVGVSGVAVDAAGNVFISENAGAVKITPAGVQTTVPTTGISLAYDVAVDGAGDVFLADLGGNKVVKVTPGGVQTTVPATGLSSPSGVAVDGAGNLFITDLNNNRVVRVTPSGVQTTVPASGVDHPYYPAVDAAGDVFFLNSGTGQVLKVTPGGIQSTIPISGLAAGNGVAVDAAGDVFVSDQINNVVLEVSPSGLESTVPTNGLNIPAGLAVDASGDLFIAVNGQTRVVEVNRSLPPSLNFALTNVGSTSSDSPLIATQQNSGNQPLTGTTTFNLGTSFSVLSTCGPTFSLPPGGTCSENFGFSPQSTGFQTGSAVFSDNTLNLSPLVVLQTINMTGIGGLNGHAVTAAVPNVVGFTQPVAGTTLTGAGLVTGSVSTASSGIIPSGNVIASNPAAGTQVSLGSSVKLLISSGPGQPPAPNPLSLLNNYFVTGDYVVGGVTLRGTTPVSNMVSGTINIPTYAGPLTPGVPTGADLIDGFLYWTTIENSPTPSGSNAIFLGYPISGQQIGSDLPYTDTIASVSGTLRVYRADINTYFQNGTGPTAGIRMGSGNFTVSLPAGNANGVLLSEGASLVVIYRVLSPSFPLKAVVIYDGSAIPASSTTQNVQGFYDAVNGGNAVGNVTTLYADSTGWNNPSNILAFGNSDHYNAQLNAGAAYGAVIVSTQLNNPDNDGILGAWKTGPPATDFHGGEPGYYDVKTGAWVGLPGAKAGQKDLFVQLDYMCGAILGDGSCAPAAENLFPSPDPQGSDPLAMVQQAFANAGVALHLQIGNAVPESTCVDSPGQPCQFPNEPGVIGWKNSLEFSKVWPRNFASCAAGGDCSPRFPYGQKDSYHYVLFGHSLAIPAWNTRYQTLTNINAVAGGVTTITTTDRGAQGTINYCPTRITVSGIQGMPSLNGIYDKPSCPDSQTMIIPTPTGVASWTYPNSTLPEPVIGITSGNVTSISGYSDLGGADSAVTLGLWATVANQDMSKKATVVAGTLFHEIGHTIGLGHGGLYYDTAGSYVPTFEANCKPNYQSIMNYLFQLDGVGSGAAIAFSSQTLTQLTQSSFGTVNTLLDTDPGFVGNAATFLTSTWYTPTPPSSAASPATLHCDGTPLGGDVGYRVDGSVAPITPAWSNGQNITFDGTPYSTLRGFNDVANIDLRQVGATGGQFASLASVLSFDTASTPLNIAPGGSVLVASGGTVTLGAGGSISVPGGNITVPGGGVISGGGSILFGTGGNVTLGAGGTGTISAGSNGVVGFPGGGNITLGAGGTVTLGAGGTVTLGAGGNVTLGAGGTITLGGGGTVIIPVGGSYFVPAGGTVTLGAGGNITLGAGGNVTLGAGGTVTLGAGGTVTLGGGGNVTLGAGGTVTLGGGGNVTLGAGGNITLGGGGTITLGAGGNVTLGAGGNVTLGAGGTVTLGGGGNITLGGGGNVTLGAGGTVTLGAGGNVTLGAGGTVTLGGGGNVTLGAGGTITLGGGGTITMNAAGNVTLGAGGGTINGVVDGPGTYPVGAGGTITLGGGGNVTLGAGGNVTLGGGGNITLGAGGNITLGGGGTVTLGGGGNVTLGAGGVVTLGGGGNITLGAGGNITLGGGGNVTLGGGGATSTELDYDTANSVVRPPSAPTETSTPLGVVVNWTAPGFGVVETYTIYRSVNGATPVVIGSVSGVNGNPPATTFTDTNPPTSGTVVYTITTTLAPDQGTGMQRESAPSSPAVLTIDQTIVLGSLPSSVSLSTGTLPVSAQAGVLSGSTLTPNHQLVSFTTTGPCSIGTSSIDSTGVSSAVVTLNNTGSCTITASQGGDSTVIPVASPAYNAAAAVSGTFMIVPQGSTLTSQTITFPQPPNVQYGSSPVPVSATTTSNLPITFTTAGPCSVTGYLVSITGAGKCSVTASQAGDSTYSAASVTESFSIAPAVLTVAAGNLTVSAGLPIPSLTSDYTITGYVNSESSSVLNGTAPSLSTTATSASAPGPYPITVSTSTLAATNYDFLYVAGTLTITPAATISINNIPANPVYGGSFTPTYTYSGTGAPTESTTSSTTAICKVLSGGAVSFISEGTCTLTASASATANNAAATGNPQSFSVGKAQQSITFTQPASPVTYGVSPITLSATSTSSLAVAFTIDAASTAPATFSANILTIKGAGTLVIDANQAGNTNYAAAPQVQRTIVVNQALLTVTANSLTRAYGAANPTLTVTYSNFVNGEGPSVLTGSPLLSTTAVAASLPGQYPITVTQGTLSARNYAFKFVNGTLTVTTTGSVPKSSTTCNGAYNGTFKGSLVVSKGQTCIFVAGGTTGSVTDSGGNLILQGATIGSSVTITSGSTFTIGPSTTIKGSLTIASLPKSTTSNEVCGSTVTGSLVYSSNGAPALIGSGTPSCLGNTISGSLQVASNSASVTMDGNKVGGSVQIQSNSGTTIIDGNTVGVSVQDQSNTGATQVFTNIIKNALQCQSNTSITGGGNTAATKQGQCAKF
jgi:sugar lactone lactonase YvrE